MNKLGRAPPNHRAHLTPVRTKAENLSPTAKNKEEKLSPSATLYDREAERARTEAENLSPTAKNNAKKSPSSHHSQCTPVEPYTEKLSPSHRTPNIQAEIQKPDNKMTMELIDLYQRRKLSQCFPSITTNFLHQFEQGIISEAKFENKVLTLAKIEERDEEISEKEMIRAMYLHLLTDKGTQEQTKKTRSRRGKRSRNKRSRPGREPGHIQQRTDSKQV